MIKVIFAFLFLFLVISSSKTVFQKNDCIPEFPFKSDWWGADAAYSIQLPDGRSLWVFGDTLWGDRRHIITNTQMVHNSFAMSSCENGRWTVDYKMKTDQNGEPLTFLTPPDLNGRSVWAMDGVYYDDAVWLTLLYIKFDPSTNYFSTAGSGLAKLTNIVDDPNEWIVEYFPLTDEVLEEQNNWGYPSASTVIQGSYLYIFSLYENNDAQRPLNVVRIPLNSLSTAKENLEYLAQDDTWKSGYNPPDAKVIMEKGASELSIVYHAEFKKWVAVQFDNTFLSADIWIRYADNMLGPWTDGEVIYTVPEMRAATWGNYNPNTFCYAAKEHPQFTNNPRMLRFTYVCNGWVFDELETYYDIYFPKTVSLEILPKSAFILASIGAFVMSLLSFILLV